MSRGTFSFLLIINLNTKNKVVILADRHHIFYDAIFDNEHKDSIVVRDLEV